MTEPTSNARHAFLPAYSTGATDASDRDITIGHAENDPDGLLAARRTARELRAELRQAADDTDDDAERRRLDERVAGCEEIVAELTETLITYLDAGGRLPSVWTPRPARPTPEPELAAAGLICTCGAATDEGCTCPTRVYNDHTDDLGNWCPWSGRIVDRSYGDDDVCPAMCRASYITEQQA